MQNCDLYSVMICVFCLFLPHFWMLSGKVSMHIQQVFEQHLSDFIRGIFHQKHLLLAITHCL